MLEGLRNVEDRGQVTTSIKETRKEKSSLKYINGSQRDTPSLSVRPSSKDLKKIKSQASLFTNELSSDRHANGLCSIEYLNSRLTNKS